MFGQLGLPIERRSRPGPDAGFPPPCGVPADRVPPAVADFLDDLAALAHSTDLLERWAALLTGPLGATSFHVFLHDPFSERFVRVRCHPPRPLIPVDGLGLESAAVRLFQRPGAGPLLAGPVGTEWADPLAAAAAGWLGETGQELAVPLVAGRNLLGLLTLASAAGVPWSASRVAEQAVVAHAVSTHFAWLLAQERLDLVGYVSPGLAHDLRNLLTPIATCLLLTAEPSAQPAQLQGLLPLALRNLELIEQQLARTHRPADATGWAVGSLGEAIGAAAAWLAPEAAHRRVQLHLAAAPAVRLSMDRVLIERLLAHLLTRALRRAPAGSQVRVDWRQTPDGQWAEVTVSDHGPGLAPAALDGLGLPPLLLASLPAGARASRLGLAVCREIVARHGGRLRWESELGRGTSVRVQLPVAPAAGGGRI